MKKISTTYNKSIKS